MPWNLILEAGLGLADSIFRGRDDQRQVGAYNAQGENALNAQVWNTLARLLPSLSREQTLDPARNAVLADIIGRHFPGVDPSVVSNLQSAGARSDIPKPPQFIRAPQPSGLEATIGAGMPIVGDIFREWERKRRQQGQVGTLPPTPGLSPERFPAPAPGPQVPPIVPPPGGVFGPTQFLND